jgi:hypothetical protein
MAVDGDEPAHVIILSLTFMLQLLELLKHPAMVVYGSLPMFVVMVDGSEQHTAYMQRV